MPDRRAPVLTDAETYPDSAVLAAVLEAAWPAWQALLAGLADGGLTAAWRWYRDGGWLCKVTVGRRTAAWLAAWAGYATVTCYLPARLVDDFATHPLPDAVVAAARGARDRATGDGAAARSVAVVVELRSLADVPGALAVVTARVATR